MGGPGLAAGAVVELRERTVNSPAGAAGTWKLGDLTVNRLGFGAMRLTGSLPYAHGVPSDRQQAIAVLLPTSCAAKSKRTCASSAGTTSTW